MNKSSSNNFISVLALTAGLLILSLLPQSAHGMYDPKHGRWLQRDPIGVRLGARQTEVVPGAQYGDGGSLYEYVRSRPCIATDPFGLTLVIPTFDDGPIGVEWHGPGNCPKSSAEMLSSLRGILGALRGKGIKTVFYVSFLEPDCSCPFCSPKGNLWSIRRVFREGLQAINADGHIIALHSYKHGLFQHLFASQDDIKSDIEMLIDEIGKAGVPFKRLWRPPYGGYQTAAVEGDIAKELGLTFRRWEIDSHDWEHHYDNDSMLKGLYEDEEEWLAHVERHLKRGIYWNGGDGRWWTDILFHVNSRTSRKLGHLLSFIEDRYNDTYKNRWGPGKDFYWSTDVSHPDFQDYLSGD